MSVEQIKIEVKDKLERLIAIISDLNICPYLKIKILKLFIFPKLNFELKTYDLSYTWIANELDSIVKYNIRRWFELPISACVGEMFRLPLNKGGLALPSLVKVTTTLRVSARHGLQTCERQDIRKI